MLTSYSQYAFDKWVGQYEWANQNFCSESQLKHTSIRKCHHSTQCNISRSVYFWFAINVDFGLFCIFTSELGHILLYIMPSLVSFVSQIIYCIMPFLYRNINGLSPLDLAGGHSDLMEVLHTEVQGVITPLTLQVWYGLFCWHFYLFMHVVHAHCCIERLYLVVGWSPCLPESMFPWYRLISGAEEYSTEVCLQTTGQGRGGILSRG